jgi:hydroxymethylbilane synthase
MVQRALKKQYPAFGIRCVTRASAGDQDQTSPLWQLPAKGAFTADLSQALLLGEADVVVHSFKDLPIEAPAHTRVAGALHRADARDVLLVRRAVVAERPDAVTILSSSPRRAWLLKKALPALLPWIPDSIEAVTVRGNIETRLRKLVEGREHGLVMAKAALDRLLTFGPPFEDVASIVRKYLDECHWMVLPMREFPWAPAQGAIALEIAEGRDDLQRILDPILHAPTFEAVEMERRVLAGYGGGCHQALGAAVAVRDYGRVVSVRARGADQADVEKWELEPQSRRFPKTSRDRMWPGPGDEVHSVRHAVAAERPVPASGLWATRAEALPPGWAPTPETLVWSAGSKTWQKLAAQGVWVHGCTDSLGDSEKPGIDALAGREVHWVRLTHTGVSEPDSIATYAVHTRLPEDLPARSHFFWMSGELFSQAIDRWPSLREAWHGSGPGRTREVIQATLGRLDRTGVWLDRESWGREICL